MAWYNTDLARVRVAVDSVVAQDYPGPIELIVGVDGGADQTSVCALQQLLTRRATGRVTCRVVARDTRGGASAVRNLAVTRASGAWLLLLDADDALAPDAVRILIERAVRDEPVMVTAQCWFHQDSARLLREPGHYLALARQYHGTLSDPLAQTVFSLHPMMVSRRAFADVGGFSLAYTWAAEVTELFARLVVRYGVDRVCEVPRPLYHYFRHGNGLSADRARMQEGRVRLLSSYCAAMGLPAQEVRYLARSENTGAQHFALIVDGAPRVPEYVELRGGKLRLRTEWTERPWVHPRTPRWRPTTETPLLA
jgi:glycosyltransferase involved in cell wall biosynthesis